MYKKTFQGKYLKPFILISSFLFIFIILNQNVYAWENCPFGEVNESYPGTCGRYIDTDNDNICDLSQSSPEKRAMLTQEDNTENNSTSIKSVVSKSNSGINYYFVPIAAILFIVYLTTLILSRNKKIKLSQHRKIWNFILLITFLISGTFGIILAIIVSYGIRLSFYSDLLFWHVEMGISMAIISIFHILWHLKYFKKMFKLVK
jgi:hypothetical protein